MNNGIISWSSKKQETVARSSTEAEYVALDHCSRQVIWLKSLNDELGFNFKQPIIYGDNLSALKLAKNPVFHQRTKHINIKYHAIRELIENDIINIEHVSTENMLADPLTKSLSSPKLNKFIKLWGMCTLRAGVDY